MKIFSNFDTRLKQEVFNKWKLEFGEGNVMILSKSKLFRLVKVDIPVFIFWGISVALLFFLEKWFDTFGFIVGASLVLLVAVFIVMPKIIGYIIDFNMDFVIVTPKQLLRYDQDGIIKRDIVTISVESIKTVTVKKRSLLYSMFDNGDIIFLTEGDENKGEVTLHYIKDPETLKTKIMTIISK